MSYVTHECLTNLTLAATRHAPRTAPPRHARHGRSMCSSWQWHCYLLTPAWHFIIVERRDPCRVWPLVAPLTGGGTCTCTPPRSTSLEDREYLRTPRNTRELPGTPENVLAERRILRVSEAPAARRRQSVESGALHIRTLPTSSAVLPVRTVGTALSQTVLREGESPQRCAGKVVQVRVRQ